MKETEIDEETPVQPLFSCKRRLLQHSKKNNSFRTIKNCNIKCPNKFEQQIIKKYQNITIGEKIREIVFSFWSSLNLTNFSYHILHHHENVIQ